MIRRTNKLFGGFSSIGKGYRNTVLRNESQVNANAGRGNAGTSAFFKEAMQKNVDSHEEKLRQAALQHKRGWELEADELLAVEHGVGQSNH